MMRLILCAAVYAASFAVSPLSADDLAMSPSLARVRSLYDLTVESGRIVARSDHRGRSSTSSSSSGSKLERLSVNLHGNWPRLDYHRSSPEYDVSININGGADVAIECIDRRNEADRTVKFRQQPEGPISLLIEVDGQANEYKAEGWWHMLLVHEDVARTELVPLLRILEPEWRPLETAGEVQQWLFRFAAGEDAPNRQRWEELIAQLGDEKFERRREAEIELRDFGQQMVGYLQTLDLSEQSPEQRFRIRRIVKALTGAGNDSPALVAKRLQSEPMIWMAMLDSEDLHQRTVAKGQLEAAIGKPIAFDVDGEEATRRAQLALLREMDKERK